MISTPSLSIDNNTLENNKNDDNNNNNNNNIDTPPPINNNDNNNNNSKKRRKLPSMPSSSTGRNHVNFNVDYFSHNWDELDLKASWSAITKHKKTFIDGIRLENASWRKWMQKRLNLKQIDPQSLRWKKDEDITWLYGPFCKSSTNVAADDGCINSIINISSDTTRNNDETDHYDNVVVSHITTPVTFKKKSSIKTHSVVSDLKKFQVKLTQAAPVFSTSTTTTTTVNRRQKRHSLNSISDPNLINDHVTTYLKSHEKILLEQMNSGPPSAASTTTTAATTTTTTTTVNSSSIISSLSSPTSISTASNHDDDNDEEYEKLSNSRLRFNDHVQVLEFGNDWNIVDDKFTHLTVKSDLSLHDQDECSVLSFDSSASFNSHLAASNISNDQIEVSSPSPDSDIKLHDQSHDINQRAQNIPSDNFQHAQSHHPDIIKQQTQNQDGPGWVSSVFSYATDIVSRYYSNNSMN